MIENKDKSGEPNKGEQLKRFPFFNVENIPEKVADVASHPVTFAQLKIRNIKAIYPKYDDPNQGCISSRMKLRIIRSMSTQTKSLESGSLTQIVPS
jgi:tellurite resistance-related uncharacterized protein